MAKIRHKLDSKPRKIWGILKFEDATQRKRKYCKSIWKLNEENSWNQIMWISIFGGFYPIWTTVPYAHSYSSHIVATFGHYPTNGCHMREWWQLILTPVTTLLPICQGLTISKWWANFAARNSWTDQNSDRRRWKIPNEYEIENADSVL